jgi:YD repeat-containing protein
MNVGNETKSIGSTFLSAPRLRQRRGRIANDYATDPLARLTGTWLLNSSQQTLSFHGYEHNLRNDITRHTRTDASFVDYDYDDLGQLTDAVGSGGQSVELLAYGYDTGWNMTSDGTTGYFVNDRNQVTGMTDGTNLGYDAHGNLLGQDNWNQQYGLIYTYDAENRLTRVEEDTYYKPNALRTEFVYDGLSRLRIRKEYLYTSGWALTGETRYLYDGRRVIQERSSANTPTVTYTRGSDLSGSLEGAGGIGGMLARSHGYSGSTGAWRKAMGSHLNSRHLRCHLMTTVATARRIKRKAIGSHLNN